MSEIKTFSKAFRAYCLGCSGTAHEVKICTVTHCELYPFRFGKNPYLKKREYTDEQKQAMRERLNNVRSKSNALKT